MNTDNTHGGAEPSPASAGSQGPDITVRLRRWTHSVDAVFASDIMDEAAGVIEKLRRRLRLLDAAVRSQPTLTDEERESIEWAAQMAGNNVYFKECDTLRALLARLK
jgi:hypothetical protein